MPRNLRLPDRDDGWGEFVLEAAEPHAGKVWTDSGKNRDRRQLKQRAIGEVRRVPCPPVLTRAAVFTPEVYASQLAETPHDLRHAAVSTWLNAGISPTQVAEWAGQSPWVLWRTYAKCLAGGEAELRRRMEAGYGGRPATPSFGTYSAQILVEGR